MKQSGLSLIELILFIVIIGLLSTVLFSLFGTIVKYNQTPTKTIQARLEAASRLELLLAAKREKGFAGFTDPCTGAPTMHVCQYSTRLIPTTLPLTDRTKHEQTIEVEGFSNDKTVTQILTLQLRRF